MRQPARFFARSASPRHARGAAAVEFALVIGVLLLVVAGIVEFGRLFWHYDALAKATRNGARQLSVAPLDVGSAAASVNAAKTLVANAVAAAGVPGFDTGDVGVDCDGVADCGGLAASPMHVTVVANLDITLGQIFPFILVPTQSEPGSWTSLVTLAPHTTMRYMLP